MKTQKGVAIIEFALVLPVLLILSMIVFDLGHALYRYNYTAKAVRDAVRYLSTKTSGTGASAAANLIVYGNTQGTGPVLDPQITTGKVSVSWALAGSDPVINTVTVRIRGYGFQPMVANMFGTGFGTLTFSDITATMRAPL